MAADRTVKVKLIGTADTRDYDRGVEKMIAETKVAEKAIGNLDERATPALTDLGKSADKAGLQLHDAGGEVAVFAAKARDVQAAAGKAEDSVEALGQKAKTTGGDIHFLDAEIARLKLHMRDLALEIDRTGNVDLFKDIKSDKGELSRLAQIRKLMTPDVGKALAVVPTEVKVAGIALGVALAAGMSPALAAGISGAIAGGVGLGGIAGGIALAAQNSRVKAAAADLGHSVMGDLTAAGDMFVQPTLNALNLFKREWDKSIYPGLHEGLSNLVDDVDDLAIGGVKFAKGFLDGVERAFGTDAVQVFSAELPALGSALGDLIGDVSESEGAMSGLRATMQVITATIDGTNIAITGLSDGFEAQLKATGKVAHGIAAVIDGLAHMRNDLPLVSSGLEGVAGWFHKIDDITSHWLGNNPALGRSNSEVAKSLREEADAAGRAAVKTKALKDIFGDLYGAQMSSRSAARAFEQAIDDAAESVKEHGHSLNIMTEDGRANQEMIDDLINSAEGMYEAEIKSGDGSEEAAKKAQKNYAGRLESIRTLLKGLGFEKGAIDDIINALGAIPAVTNTIVEIGVRTTDLSSRTPGEHSGHRVSDLTGTGTKSATKKSDADKRGLASGGYAPMNGAVTVGEEGMELLTMRAGRPYVMSAPQTRTYLGGGGGTMTITVPVTLLDPMTGDVTRQALITRAVNAGVSQAQARAAYP